MQNIRNVPIWFVDVSCHLGNERLQEVRQANVLEASEVCVDHLQINGGAESDCHIENRALGYTIAGKVRRTIAHRVRCIIAGKVRCMIAYIQSSV